MKTLHLIFASLFFVLCACQMPPEQMTGAERSQIEVAVSDGLKTFLEGLNTRDGTLAVSIADPEIDFVDFGRHYQNQADLRVALERLLAEFQSWDSVWDDIQVDVVRPDLALFFGQFTMSRRFLDGRLQESDPYIFVTGKFELTEAGWKLTHAHLSGANSIVEEYSGKD